MKALVFLELCILVASTTARDFDYCYAFDQDPYLYMGTKTAYQFVQGRSRLKPVPNCTPVQVWILSRHGTRYPGRRAINELSTLPKLRDQIVYNHENRGLGHLCNADLEYLKNWQLNSNLNDYSADELTRQGEQDMQLFAKRLQTDIPELLRVGPQYINAENFKFRSTDTQRTRDSLEAFMDGLFNNRNAVPTEVTPPNDMLLHPDKNCPSWQRQSESDEVYRESDRFFNGPEYQNLIHNVSRRLGFGHQLKNNSIQLMYDMCRYEKAWDISRLSVWCSIFSREEMRILEYREDLEYYYYSGPGREVNAKLGCNLVKDMFGHFKNLEQGNFGNEPKGVFYFSHTTPLLNFLSALSIGKDAMPLMANNFHSMERRSFKTSIIGSFSANLVAIFYRCSDPRSPNKVMFYLDEMAVTLDGCKVGLCDWEFLKDRFGYFADSCNLDFCYSTDSATSLSGYGILFVSGFAVLRSLFAL